MSKLYFFENEFTNKYTEYVQDKPTAIKDIVEFDKENVLIFVNGFKKDEKYVLQDDDRCVIRVLSNAQVAIGLAIVIFEIAAFLIADKIVEAISGKSIIDHIKSWFKKDMPHIKDPEMLKKIPQIRGGQNQYCTDKPYPLIIGKHLLNLLYIAYPYTTVTGDDGEEQYFHALYIAGYNNSELTNFKLGELLLATNSEKITNGSIICDGLFKSNNPQLEIQQGNNEVSLYPQKVIEEQLSIELINVSGKDPLEVIRFTARNPQKVEVEILLNALLSYDDKGNKGSYTVTLKCEWRNIENETWLPFAGFGNNPYDIKTGITTITRAKSKQMRFVATRTFNYNEIMSSNNRIIEIRVIRVNKQAENTKIQDKIYLSGLRTWCFDYEKSKETKTLVPQIPVIEKEKNKIVRIGFKIKAGDEIQGIIKKLNCIVQSCARTWDTTNKTWSTTEIPTQNPASIVLKLMQSQMLGYNAYNDDKIDLISFGEFYEWCEQKEFTCNGVLTNEKKLSDVIDMLLYTSRAFRILNGKKYGILIDKPRTLPITIINNQNILQVTNVKEFKKLPNGFRINFIDEYDGYQKNEMVVMFEGKKETDSDVIIETLDMPYITSRNQIYKNAHYIYACRKLRPEIWDRKLGIDGNLLYIGCLVEMQDDTILVGIGDGAEIKQIIIENNYITKIIVDSVFEITDLQNRYGIKVVHADGINEPVVKTLEVIFTSTQSTKEFTFKTPILQTENILAIGDIIAFGVFDRITTDVICWGKKDNGDGTFDCTFIPYAEGIYSADSGVMPEFDSKLTVPNFEKPVIPTPYVTREDIANSVKIIQNGTDDLKPDILDTFTAIAQKDSIIYTYTAGGKGLNNSIKDIIVQLKKSDNSSWEDVSNIEYIFDRVKDKYPEANYFADWRFRAKAINIYGNKCDSWKETRVNIDKYGTWEIFNPIVKTTIFNRTVSFVFLEKSRADNKPQYGTIQYQIQIKRLGTNSDINFYKPAESLDPYADENNYKDGLGFVIAGNTYNQTLPLIGQNATEATSKETIYQYKIIAVSEAGKSKSEFITVTVLPTGVQDLVDNAITANKIATGAITKDKIHANTISATHLVAEDLSATGAMFGAVSSSIIKLNSTNWMTTKKTNIEQDDGSIYKAIPYEVCFGSTVKTDDTVSDNDEFFHFIPKKGFYFKIKNFLVTAIGSFIKGILYVVNYAKTLRLKITEKTLYFEKKENETWTNTGAIGYDDTGNFIISDTEDRPIEVVNLENNFIKYSLSENMQDNNGKNAKNIETDGAISIDNGFLNKRYFQGRIGINTFNGERFYFWGKNVNIEQEVGDNKNLKRNKALYDKFIEKNDIGLEKDILKNITEWSFL